MVRWTVIEYEILSKKGVLAPFFYWIIPDINAFLDSVFYNNTFSLTTLCLALWLFKEENMCLLLFYTSKGISISILILLT